MPASAAHNPVKPAGSLRAGFVVSLAVHLAGAALIGAMPRAVHHPGSGLEAVDQVVILEPPPDEAPPLPEPTEPERAERPKPQPDPARPEPDPVPPQPLVEEQRRVRLGSPTSTSEAPTMAWIGFDTFMEHSGPQSVVDQPQLTMDAPGAPGLPGLPIPPRTAVEPRPSTPEPTLTTLPELPGGPPPAPASPAAPTQPERLVAHAADTPLVISERETRPKQDETKPSAPAPIEPPRAAQAPEPSPAQPAQAPPPASRPAAESAEDKQELAAPAAPNDQGQPTVQPKPGRAGAEHEPQSPIGDKEIPKPKNDRASAGPEQPQRPEVPAVPDTEPAESPKPAVEPPQPQQPPAPRSIEAGDFSQGPRPEEQTPPPPSNPADPSPPARPVEPAPPNPSAASKPAPAVPPIPPRSAGNGRDGTGMLSDRESVAAAIKKAITVDKWGQPLVAKGLKIRTVRPRFTKYTEITSSGAPVVRLLFDRSGRVRDVVVLRSSGNPDVDRPVIDAAYQWTAEGKELETLRENPPETIAIDVRVIR